MRDGLKRNIKYLTRYQARMMFMYVIGALLYGIAMAFFMADPGEEMQIVCNFFGFFLAITMLSMQMNIMLCVPPIVLSMSSTRRDLIIGHRIMSVELVTEVTVLLTISLFLAGREDGVSLLFCLMRSLISVLYISALGVMMSMLPRNENGFGVATLLGLVIAFIIVGICSAVGGDIVLTVIEAIAMGRKEYLWAAGIALMLLALLFTVIVYGAAARRIRRMEVRC